MSKICRCLFADFRAGKNIHKLKSSYLKKFNISARYFNSIRIYIDGVISSVKEINKQNLKDLGQKIKSLKNKIKKLETKVAKAKSKCSSKDKRHLFQLNRRLIRLNNRYASLEKDIKNNVIRICFGGKKLFNKYKNLFANNYACHTMWLKDFRDARNSSFSLVGSKDETAGNQSCMASINAHGLIDLKLRLPYFITGEKDSGVNPASVTKYLELKNLEFSYGHDDIMGAIVENATRNYWSKQANKLVVPDKYKQHGTAINYRFVKDKKGYALHVTISKTINLEITSLNKGVIAVDINQDHLAVANVSKTGKLIESFTIGYNIKHATNHQVEARLGEAIKELIKYAIKHKKPIAIEDLDFSKKKVNMQKDNKNKKRNYLLSSFAYAKITQGIITKAFRNKIKVYTVDPKDTSIIGRIKYASKDSSISVHEAAALCIGRKLLGFNEKMPKVLDNIPTTYGKHVSRQFLVKMAANNSCDSWHKINRALSAVARLHYLGRLDAHYSQHLNGVGPPQVKDLDDELPANW